MFPSCCIIIPSYKEKPNKYEILALIQCQKILNEYHICIVVPYGLNTIHYDRLLKKHHTNYHFEFFDKRFFDGIQGYNHLMLSPEFYQRFLSFDYILIYQLDAYVFFNKLDYWCSKGLNYLGAPIPYGLIHDVEITHNKKYNDTLNLPYAYNGGASLRKVGAFLDTLSENNTLITKWLSEGLNEDIIFSSLLLQNCRIPDSEALQFCIDNFPRECVSRIEGQLPMLCHGWTKLNDESAEYDGLFWLQYIWKWEYWKLYTRKRIYKKIKKCLHR